MKSLRYNAYRFSISQPRILPKGRGTINEKGISFYSKLVDALLNNGIRPIVTLYHLDIPQTLQEYGGWINRDIAFWFSDYAELVVKRLDDRVKDWITLNEPASFIYGGYINGGSAPDIRNRRLGFSAAHNANRAHGMSAKAIKSVGVRNARVGISLNLLNLEPANNTPTDISAMQRVDAKKNLLFLDAVCRAKYSPLVHATIPELAEWVKPEDFNEIQAPLDFLGVNYYHHLIVKDAPQSASQKTTITTLQPIYGFLSSSEIAEVVTMADGLRRVLLRVHKDYGVCETVITENGFNIPEDKPESTKVHD